jgi:hypothetical protein
VGVQRGSLAGTQLLASHALAADPIGVQARWSVVTGCCAYCAGPLTDDVSREYGIDEECRTQPITGKVSKSLLREYARAVARYTKQHGRMAEAAIAQAV